MLLLLVICVLGSQIPLLEKQVLARPYENTCVISIQNPSEKLLNSPAAMALLPTKDWLVPKALLSSLQNYTLVSCRVQEMVDEEMKRLLTNEVKFDSFTSPATWFSDYHRYDEILKFYQQLEANYPHLVSFIPSIGSSYLGKDIAGLRIGNLNGNADGKKVRQFWFHAGDHAREWIGPACLQYFIHDIVTSYDKNETIRSILTNSQLIVVPLMNVDGYEHTWNGNRLWRKNRKPTGGIFGSVGVDLNRNWPEHWGEQGGSSSFPWAEDFRGPSAASEPEVKALIDFFTHENHTELIGAIDFHSYSQLVLRPYGFTRDNSPDEAIVKKAGDGIRDTIRESSGKTYRSIREIDLYKATGTASDWFYGKDVMEWLPDRRLYSFTIELRPSESEGRGADGFILPPEQIVPTGKEITNAMVFYMDFALKNVLLT